MTFTLKGGTTFLSQANALFLRRADQKFNKEQELYAPEQKGEQPSLLISPFLEELKARSLFNFKSEPTNWISGSTEEFGGIADLVRLNLEFNAN